MLNSNLLVAAVTLSLTLVPYANAGGRGTPERPVVDSSEVDSAQRIILSGRNFGDRKPIVTLGDRTLEVDRSSQTQVVASLPKNIRPATYRVLVHNTQSLTSTEPIYLHISVPAKLAAY